MTDSTAAAFNAFRLIDDGTRTALHRVAIDDAGAVIAFDPEPLRIEVPSSAGGDSTVPAALVNRWRIDALALQAVHAIWDGRVLLLRDGKLIELPAHGGEDAELVRVPAPALAA